MARVRRCRTNLQLSVAVAFLPGTARVCRDRIAGVGVCISRFW